MFQPLLCPWCKTRAFTIEVCGNVVLLTCVACDRTKPVSFTTLAMVLFSPFLEEPSQEVIDVLN